jgi:hypothetical protein
MIHITFKKNFRASGTIRSPGRDIHNNAVAFNASTGSISFRYFCYSLMSILVAWPPP